MLHGSPVSYDLILRGGRVVDPSQKLDAVTDVAFAQGKVARIGAGLLADAKADIRDVSGRIVTAGLIDLHTDRKSTRLNSSHGYISYALFCLKKKNPSTYGTHALRHEKL